MRILLVAPPFMDYAKNRLKPMGMDEKKQCPPYGMYMLARILKDQGYEVVLADLIAEGTGSLKSFDSYVDSSSLIGISASSLSWPTAVRIIKEIRKKNKEVPIVLGGIHPTMFDRYIISNFPVQYVLRGEGEESLPALCRAIEGKIPLESIPNLTWKNRDLEVVRNDIAPLISDHRLSDYPVPDYSILPDKVYMGLSIESSRGCAFDCSYCSTSYRKSWRGIGPEVFVDRMELVMENLHRTSFGTVHIIDDEFSTNPARATEIAKIIRKRGLNPKLIYDTRASDILYDGFIENIAEYTYQFLVGAECGYDEGLKRVGKGITCKTLEDAAKMLLKANLSHKADFSFILGLPGETMEEIKKTIKFAMYLVGNYGVRVLLQWYVLIPGSRLWNEDYMQGKVTEAMYDDFGIFRNLYLFRTGVPINPKDIWEISDMVGQLSYLTGLRYPGRKMVEYSMPFSIAKYLPRETLYYEDTGLQSLRQVARFPVKVGIPQRHLPGCE